MQGYNLEELILLKPKKKKKTNPTGEIPNIHDKSDQDLSESPVPFQSLHRPPSHISNKNPMWSWFSENNWPMGKANSIITESNGDLFSHIQRGFQFS